MTVGLVVAGLAHILGNATLPVAALLAALSVAVLRQRSDTQRLEKRTKMLAGITLTAEDVLADAARADTIAAAAEEGFREAAERRAMEAEYIAKHGQRDSMITGTYSGTFEHLASQQLQEWNPRFEALTTKLEALGFRVFVPSEPRHKIEGEPTAAATKLVCEREALDVAADALRAANESSASDVRQTDAAA